MQVEEPVQGSGWAGEDSALTASTVLAVKNSFNTKCLFLGEVVPRLWLHKIKSLSIPLDSGLGHKLSSTRMSYLGCNPDF